MVDGRGAAPAHGTQRAIMEILEERPGTSIRTLANKVDVPYSTVRYHVRRLVKAGMIERHRYGRKVRLFLEGASAQTRVLPLLRESQVAKLLRQIARDGGPNLTINGIAEDLDVDFGFVKRTLVTLRDRGFLEMEKVLGRYRIRANRRLVELLDEVET